MPQTASLTDLDFVHSVEGRLVSTWSPARTGDYTKDCAAGRSWAKQLLGLMQRQSNPILLGQVMQGMVAGGIYAGVEIGFMQGISESLR